MRALLLLVAFTLGCVGQEAFESCNGLDDDGDGLVDEVACAESYACSLPDRCTCRAGYHRCGTACVSDALSYQTCFGSCTNLRADVNHCGTCGHRCGYQQRCVEGVCIGSLTSSESLCAGRVVNLVTDAANCGGCAIACPEGTTCSGARCQCEPGRMLCDSACVDTQSDHLHCGGCGRRCGEGEPCVQGVCACAEGRTRCGSECVDTSRSTRHCGACNNLCAPTATCFQAECVCPTGQTHCDGQCVVVRDHPFHCGACGARCAGEGQRCADGVCRCENGLTPCGDACVDTQTDSAHCGACGVVCGAGRSCATGACTPLPRTPLAGARIGAARPTFRWDAGDATVEVCADRACATVVSRATGTAAMGATLAEDLAPGAYSWRVVREGQTRATSRALVIDARHTRSMGLLPPSPDVDGDGRADVVVLSTLSARVYALHAGAEAPAAVVGLDFMGRTTVRVVPRVSGDLDSDGRVDLAFSLFSRMYASRYSGPETTEITPWSTLGDLLPLADLDRDGAVDLAEFTDGGLRVSYGAALGMDFGLGGVVARHDTVAPVGDLDGDGVDDIVVSTPASSPPRAYAYLGSSAGLDRSWLLPPSPRSAGFGAWVAPAGDVNGDGHADALVAMGTAGAAVYLGGADAITFHRAITSTTGDDLRVLAAGDIDGDGFYDLLAIPAAGSDAQLYRGSATGLAATPVVIHDDRFAVVETAGAIGDRDGDGLDDVVLGAPSRDLVMILHGARGAAPSRVTEIHGDPGSEFGRAVL